MGIACSPDRMFTSGYAAALYLEAHGAVARNAYIIGETGISDEFAAVGINPVTETDTLPYTNIDYVIVGIDRAFTYDKLQFAHACISRGHAEFIATNRDATFPVEGGEIPEPVP